MCALSALTTAKAVTITFEDGLTSSISPAAQGVVMRNLRFHARIQPFLPSGAFYGVEAARNLVQWDDGMEGGIAQFSDLGT